MASAEAALAAALARLKAATDERERCEHALWVDEYRSIVASKSILRVRLPNITFSGHMAFHGPARSAELLELAGHTASDAVLLLPQDGIAFVSDLLFVECHPYLADGDPSALLHALQTISGLAPKTVVPGHGPVGTAGSLAQLEQYIHTLDGLARRMVEAGEAEETIDTLPTPEPYDDWLVASFFRANLHFLYRRHRQNQAPPPS